MSISVASCRICGSAIKPFMTFGRMPISNGFLTQEQIADEYFYELEPSFCDSCGMFQIIEQPAPQKMFHENYAFISSTSRFMEAHFKRFAELVMDRYLAGQSSAFVVELGSNDGIMLRNFKAKGYRHLGIEPSTNVASIAQEQGIQTISAFFDKDLADQIVSEHGRADAILAANVMCHIPNLPSVIEGMQRLLKPDGVVLFEDPYLGDVIEKGSYDQIYDEHVFLFSATSISWAFSQHGFELIDVMPQITHGGSMRYVLAKKGSRWQASPEVARLIDAEKARGIGEMQTYLRFKARCEASRIKLMDVLEDLHSKGRRVVGYGATAKSATVTNYCGITAKHLEFISDTTPTKQNKLSPGAHIPVKHYSVFTDKYPDYALLFAWNHEVEIREKEKQYAMSGGKWILYVPEVRIAL